MLGPLFQVEMVTSSRRARYVLLRMVYCAILLLLLWIAYESVHSYRHVQLRHAANIAAQFFNSMAYAQLLCVLLLAPAMAAGTIAVERERRTIEYLLASDLTNSEIVFGKVLARALQVSAILLAGIPVLAIAMLMGGVAPQQLWQLALFTSATLLLVIAISVAISLRAHTVREAIGAAYVCIVGLVALPLLILWAEQTLGISIDPSRWIVETNPFFVVSAIAYDGMRMGNPTDITLTGTACYLALTAALLGWTTLTLRSTMRRALTAVSSRRKGAGWWSSRPPVPRQAVLWKELYCGRQRGWRGWWPQLLELGVLALVLVLLVQQFHNPYGNHLYTLSLATVGVPLCAAYGLFRIPGRGFLLRALRWGTTIWAVMALLLVGLPVLDETALPRNSTVEIVAALLGFAGSIAILLVAARAGSLISGERERETWLTLLSTPLTPREIVWGKVAGNMFALRRWGYYLLAILLVAGLRERAVLYAAPWIVLATVVLAFFASALGVYASLVCRSTLRALAVTIGILVGLGLTPVLLLILAESVRIHSSGGEPLLVTAGLAVPFQFGFPTVAISEYLRHIHWGNSFANRELGYLVTGNILGLVGFGMAAAVLYHLAIGQFETICGRLWSLDEYYDSEYEDRWVVGPPQPVAAAAILAAESQSVPASAGPTPGA